MFKLGPHEVLIGLGSNAPDALGMLRRARSRLRRHPKFRLCRSSAIYESDALLPPGAPSDWNRSFLNAACRVEFDGLDSEAIVTELKKIEKSLGRADSARWAPRAIDLDLLAWGRPDVRTERVSVPHPGLRERPFALLPAADCVEFEDEPKPYASWRWGTERSVPLRTRITQHSWTELVAILNLTPDSFSDGRERFDREEVREQALRLVRQGATVIDVGAESTRPGATPVSPREEWERLEPHLQALFDLKKTEGIRISLDSRHAETVGRVLERFPLDWINDVEGFTDAGMSRIAAQSRCELVVMHSLGVPPGPDRVLSVESDPVQLLLDWGKKTLSRLQEAGIDPDRMILDPGIGFGKTPAQNLALLERAEELHAAGAPLLYGYSRKRFLDPGSAVPARDRDLETAVITARVGRAAIDYVRVHDPASQTRALKLGMLR